MILLLLVALATAETVHYCETLGTGGYATQITAGGPDCKKSMLGHVEVYVPAHGYKTELAECALSETFCEMPMDDMDESDKAGFPKECTIESYKTPIPQTYKDSLGVDTCEKYIAMMEENKDTDGSESEISNLPCDQAQTQTWEKAWVDKVAEAEGDLENPYFRAVADACNAILKGDLENACTCMNAFEMPPPNCVLESSGSNPYGGWQMCKAPLGPHPTDFPEDQCKYFDKEMKDMTCKGLEFENCAKECMECSLFDSCPPTCLACTKFACCIEEPEEIECDPETSQKWWDMFGMKMAMQGAVGDACKQVLAHMGDGWRGKMDATCTCMGSFTEEEMRPFKDCTIDGEYVTAFKTMCDDGQGKDEYCKTFDKKTCQGAEFDLCMRMCGECGMKGTCGKECDDCAAYGCCIEMPGNECDQAQTQTWGKAWNDKVAEGGDAADACNAILKGDMENVCTCMNAFEVPPPNCVLESSGSNPYDGWQMCKAPPADKSCKKLYTTSECGKEAEDKCGCFESMMENGAFPDCEMEDGKKLATMYAEKCAICDSDKAKECVKDCSVCVQCATTPRKVPDKDECTAEQQGKVGMLIMQKLQLEGEVKAACNELMAQNMENACTCLDSFTEDEISEFDCTALGQNPYAGWKNCQAAKKCSDCDKCEPCKGFEQCAIKDIFKNQCNTDAAKQCVTQCAKCIPCAVGLQIEGCEDCDATCTTCKELMHCVPTRQNCAGTFSKCTSKCEKAGGRTFTETMKQKGVGVSCPTAKNCKKGDDLCKAVKKVAMKKVKFKQAVKGITKEQCAGVKEAIRKGTAKQLKVAEEDVTVKEEGAGVCVDGSRRRLATGSQSFAVEAEVESSNVEEAKKTVAHENFQKAIVSEASQGGVKDLKTEKVEASKIEEGEVEDGKDGVFAFGTFVFGVFALLL